jgi:hypothetical protein
MKTLASLILALLTALLTGAAARAGNSAAPVGEPVAERPTLRSLGAYWVISGDDNKNAVVTLEYRKQGESQWKQGPPLFRVEKGVSKSPDVKVPEDAWLFAGSALLLEAQTRYELKLTLNDPDGGSASKTLAAQTVGEPIAPKGPIYYVQPGDGGGTGTKADPYKSIAAADKKAKPGDTFVLLSGTYSGTFGLRKSGERGKPIIWRGADETAVIDGQGKNAVEAVGVHDVWFENLAIRNAKYAIVTHESERIVVRRCHITQSDFGITATKNSKDTVNDYFITDNVIEGVSHWPRSEGIEDRRGVQISGAGHVVAYNRIHGFADAIDTFQGPRCQAIDFHNNDCELLTDDGCEMDYSQRNTRCFENRFVNVYQGISTQPIYGGPVYIVRNVLFNVCVEPFKMHNGPSGALMIHNTVVKKGMPLLLWTPKPISNCYYRNNFFVGTADNYAYENQAKATDCDFDYDGFAGGPFANFLKWNREKYATLKDVHEKAPIEKHAVHIGPEVKVFASGVMPPADEKQLVSTPPDLRLAPETPAIDAGQTLPGLNDGFSGSAPDLGAYELGSMPPHYGPRPAESR